MALYEEDVYTPNVLGTESIVTPLGAAALAAEILSSTHDAEESQKAFTTLQLSSME